MTIIAAGLLAVFVILFLTGNLPFMGKPIVRIKRGKHENDYDTLYKKYQNASISYACAEDNFNFAQNCLVRFASKIFNKPIPTYADGESWRPGDLVKFKTVLGDNTFKGEVEMNIDDEGMMQDRCPVVVRMLKASESDDERYFSVDQISDVKLVHRPEHFQEMIHENKKS